MKKACYLFGATKFPTKINEDIQDKITKLNVVNDKYDYLKAAYNFVTKNYQSGRVKTFTKLFDLYSSNLDELWSRKGFLHCTNQNYLFALLLVKSGHFSESDIKRRWTFVGFLSPHQYLKVRVSHYKWIEVDCWGRQYNIALGRHARAFNSSTFRSFAE